MSICAVLPPSDVPRAFRFMAEAAATLIVSSLLSAAPAARAAIDRGDDGNGEFFLVVWDPVKEASYTLDLGYRMDSLLVDGQKDEGFQKFWIIDKAADAQFSKLLNLGTAVTSLRWGVYAVDNLGAFGIGGFILEPGDLRVFSTLEHTVSTGTVNPNYTSLVNATNGELLVTVGAINGTQIAGLNNEAGNPDNTHSSEGADNWDFNGRSFHTKGQVNYFAAFAETPAFSYPGGPPSTNAVGSSSWAYQVLSSSSETPDTVLFDEFDNLTHDGFWGFTENPDDGTFALSYTIEGTGLTLAQRSFTQAIGRTESNGGFNTRRLSGAASSPMEAGNAFARRLLDSGHPAAASVVPEPSTWLLMGFGLGLVGWLARRRG
jgi:PEP-CTERM motif